MNSLDTWLNYRAWTGLGSQQQTVPVLLADRHIHYSLSQINPPKVFFSIFFPNDWEFFVQILHACYTFLCTLDYKFLFNYLQLSRRYAIFSATIQFTSHAQNVHHWPKASLYAHYNLATFHHWCWLGAKRVQYPKSCLTEVLCSICCCTIYSSIQDLYRPACCVRLCLAGLDPLW